MLVAAVIVPSREGSVKGCGMDEGQERPDEYGYVWGGGGGRCTGSAAAVH